MRSTFNGWYEKKMRANSMLSEETDQIEKLLRYVQTIAIVGISRNHHKDSQYVGRYLQNAGYRIVPVNPEADEILGEKAYTNVNNLPFKVDIVDMFLRPEFIPETVNKALAISPVAVWLQLGSGTHPQVKEKVEKSECKLMQNRCIKVDHQFLIRPKQKSGKLNLN